MPAREGVVRTRKLLGAGFVVRPEVFCAMTCPVKKKSVLMEGGVGGQA